MQWESVNSKREYTFWIEAESGLIALLRRKDVGRLFRDDR